jgi:hypothetical protein
MNLNQKHNELSQFERQRGELSDEFNEKDENSNLIILKF